MHAMTAAIRSSRRTCAPMSRDRPVTTAGSTGRGSMAREDIAAVLLANFDAPDTGGQTFEIITGGTPISDA